MELTLRPYQERAVDQVLAARTAGKRRVILVLPTGGGKTEIAASLFAGAVGRGERCLFLTHRLELVDQAAARIAKYGTRVGVIQGDQPPDPSAPVQVASVQTLARRTLPPADLVITDECFPGPTLIDGKPIREICAGENISSFEEATGRLVSSRVAHVFCRPVSDLVGIHLSDGRSIVCTPNHPLYTRRGWASAGGIDVALDELLVLRTSDGDRYQGETGRVPSQRSSLLLAGVPGPMGQPGQRGEDGGHEPTPSVDEDEAEEPDATDGGQGEGVGHPQADPASPEDPRRERPVSPSTPAEVGGCTGLANGGRRDDEHAKDPRGAYSVPLQARHRESDPEGMRRGGRGVSWLDEGQGRRRAKDPLLVWTRVDRIEVLKPGSDGTFGGLCPDGLVYNLEVEGTHTYVADGAVAHNCHHAVAGSFDSVIRAYPDAFHVGLTATPYRLDGRGLGVLFEEIIVAAHPRELVELGYLVAPRIYTAPPPDLTGISKSMGDYATGQLSERMTTLTGDVVTTWEKRGDGRRTVVFAVDVRHSEALRDRFLAAGVPTEHFDGTDDRETRGAVLSRFRSGATRVLSNCSLISEGFDLPEIGCVVMARPTQSRALYKQQSGRALRPSAGKEYAILLDNAGNFLKHGDPLDVEDYTLEDGVKVERPTPTKTCRECFAVIPASAPKCPYCGYAPPVQIREIKETATELVEVSAMTARYLAMGLAERISVYLGLVADAERAGYKPGWAAVQYRQRFNIWPEPEVVARAEAGTSKPIEALGRWLSTANERGYKQGWAAWRFKSTYGKWPSRDEVRRAQG